MLGVTIAFILSTVILALSATHLMGVIDGNEELIGLPADSGIPVFLGVVISLTAAGTLMAPFAVVTRARSKRRGKIRRR